MTAQTKIDFAKVVTDAAIARVEDNTNGKNPGWSDDCMRYFEIWLSTRKTTFMAEDFRKHVKELLPPPTHDRVFGAIMRRANYLGWIEYVRTDKVLSPSNHMARASVWRSTICKP